MNLCGTGRTSLYVPQEVLRSPRPTLTDDLIVMDLNPDDLPDVGGLITLERLEAILGFIVQTDGADMLEINIAETKLVFLREPDGRLRRQQ